MPKENKNKKEGDLENEKAFPSELSKEEEADIGRLAAERDEYLDGWKRAKAELINYKNEEFARMKELARFAGEDIIRDMITVLDSFDLAIAAINKNDSSSAKGVYMIRTQIEDTLKRKGLERIIVSVGHPFDPALQEAISVVKSDLPAGTVIEEIERGYLLGGKIIRPARVVVAK